MTSLKTEMLLIVVATFGIAFQGEQTQKLSSPRLSDWEIEGAVSTDESQDHSGQDGSLLVNPGAKAIWQLRKDAGSGLVELWVYEDGSVPSDPKARQYGPMWGLIQPNGGVLTVGAIYAPYLSGDKTYAVGYWNPTRGERPWHNVQYLGLSRKIGWHKWTFDMDPDEGLKILYDDQDVNSRQIRFNWWKTELVGFTGVVLFGDTTDADQKLWVDDITIRLGGEMRRKPTLLPERDPEPERKINLIPQVRNVHPRLLFTPEEIGKLREFSRSAGGEFFKQMERYLNVCRAPEEKTFLRNATDAQCHGLWRMPTASIHYVITGEKGSFDRALGYMKMLLELEHWEEGSEEDSGMGAANMLIGAAIAYDCLYNDLEPDFREFFREKLLQQARKMYYRGHLHKAGGPGYWKQDPQNNHRWHRDAGLTLAVLAVADENRRDDDWILAKTVEELEFVAKWLPDDGTSHEGPSYMVFGGGHLLLAYDAADRCLGTDFLGLPFFKNTVSFRMQTVTPGFKDVFAFGDCAGFGGYSNYLFRCVSRHRDSDHLAGVLELMRAQPDAFWLGWWSLVWYDPDLPIGDINRLPLARFFPDLGLGFVRDGWQINNVAIMLKCGPYGGHTLQEYRRQHNNTYINIAHDDPDANSFLIFADGEMLADYDPYANPKMTSSHNTILVNGKGQKHRGEEWTQPISGMADMALFTTWKATDNAVVMEGEAGRAYEMLTRYRRSMIWLRDRYVMILDDIRAEKPVEITWLVQSDGTEIVDEKNMRYRLKAQTGTCDFRMASNVATISDIGESTANQHGKKLGYRQLQVKATTDHWRIATVFDVWKIGDLDVKLETESPNESVVTITGTGISDRCFWHAADDERSPSDIELYDDRGLILKVDSRDKAPTK